MPRSTDALLHPAILVLLCGCLRRLLGDAVERPRVWLLLATSVAFYMSWNPWLAALVVGTASIDFLIARTMDGCSSSACPQSAVVVERRHQSDSARLPEVRQFLSDLFVALLDRCGVHGGALILHVIVPIGISFYTFEAISYSVDVYRRKIEPTQPAEFFGLHLVLSASRGRADRPGLPATFCRRLAAASVGVGCDASRAATLRAWHGQEDGDRRSHGPLCRSGLRRPGEPFAPAPCGSRRSLT